MSRRHFSGRRESNTRTAQIVGLAIEIDRLEGKFELSQTRSAADRTRVIAGLRACAYPDDLALAELMSSRTPKTAES